MLAKLDFKKEWKDLYTASAKECSLVEVHPIQYLMVDGQGDPNTAPVYKAAVEALYSVAYPLKMSLKRMQQIDYVVMPLEGLWWLDNEEVDLANVEQRQRWQWTMMIAQPDFITALLVDNMRAEALHKKPQLAEALTKLRLETYEEGYAAQVMHLGPYKDEAPTIARLHAFIQRQGYALHYKHHEIYLSDPSRSAPEKMKTILRQPVVKR